MLDRRLHAVVFALLVLTAGCSMLQPSPNTPPETDGTSSETTTEKTANSPTPTPQIQYTTEMSSGEVVLRLSDLQGSYNFVAESETTRSNASGDVKSQFSRKNITKQHKRLFEVENSSSGLPQYVISSLAIYENTGTAEHDLQQTLDTFRKKGSVSTTTLNGKTVNIATYRDRQNNYQTVAYIQQSNTVYFVLATDNDQYRPDFTLRLLTKMQADMGTEALGS